MASGARLWPAGDEANLEASTAEQQINAIGMGRFQYMLVAIFGLIVVADGMEMVVISLLYTALTRAKKRALLISSVPQLSACAPWAAASKCRMHVKACAASAAMEAAAMSTS